MSVVSGYIPILWAVVIIGIIIYTASIFIKPMIQLFQTIREYRDKNKLKKDHKESES